MTFDDVLTIKNGKNQRAVKMLTVDIQSMVAEVLWATLMIIYAILIPLLLEEINRRITAFV